MRVARRGYSRRPQSATGCDLPHARPPESVAVALLQAREQRVEIVAVLLIEPVEHRVPSTTLESVRLDRQQAAMFDELIGALSLGRCLEVHRYVDEAAAADKLRVKDRHVS